MWWRRSREEKPHYTVAQVQVSCSENFIYIIFNISIVSRPHLEEKSGLHSHEKVNYGHVMYVINQKRAPLTQ